MASRMSRRALCMTRRAFSGHIAKGQSAFTYSIPAGTKLSHNELFQAIMEKGSPAKSSSYNAAVLLATPDFVKSLEDEEFMGRLVETISPSDHAGHFDVLGGIVDHVAPLLGSYKPLSGFSVLRGHLDDMLPQLWETSQPSSQHDQDDLSAVTFNLASPSVTLPLARTTFLNGRSSTLLASRFDLSKGTTPRLTQRSEKRSQQVTCLSDKAPRGIADLGLFAPMLPLTQPRAVAESFGNIVRAIEVDEGQKVPGSTELETAVNRIHQNSNLFGFLSGPLGIWAVVTPPAQEMKDLRRWVENAPEPLSPTANAQDIQDLAASTSLYMRRLYALGGRVHKILSGGGGWGAKKGLLSLDPEVVHFPPTEEEEMERFINSTRDSSFTPKDSKIQFFLSAPVLPDLNRLLLPTISFGVAGEEALLPAEERSDTVAGFIDGHFGALSHGAIFLSGPGFRDGESTKLSVPHSRVFVAGEA